MTDFLQHPVTQALARALVHFVWQGAALGLVAFVAFRLARQSASVRYAIGVGALAAMLAAPVATFLVLAGPAFAPVATVATPGAAENSAATPPDRDVAAGVDAVAAGVSSRSTNLATKPDWLGAAAAAWLAGVLFFSLRLAGGWAVARRYTRRAVQPASEHLQALATQLAVRLGVRRVVTIVQSAGVMVPVMIGWLKPTIVLPLAALAALSPAQVEALIAHELAHVRRHDYLVNLLQSMTEALLFYHPAVWWLSRRVRADRELCCDDLAIGVCDRLVYATALTDLAGMVSPGVALAATGGDLIGRVRRILGHGDAGPAVRSGAMSALALVVVAGFGVPVALASVTPAPLSTPSDRHVVIAQPPSGDTHPQRNVRAEVQTGHPAIPTFDHIVAPQTPQTAQTSQATSQAERQAREEALKKSLEEMRLKIDEFKHAAEAQASQEATATAQAKAAREAELVAARRAVEEATRKFEVGLISESQLLAARATLEKAMVQGNAATLAQTESQALSEAVRKAQIESARKALEEAKKRFAVGLASETQVREATAALAKAEAQGDAVATAVAELTQARIAWERSLALVERGLVAPRDVVALETAFAQAEQRLLAAKERHEQMQDSLARTRESLQADARALREQLAEREALAGSPASLMHLDPATPVQVGDVVRVTIKGEPTLPETYTVAEEGMIRLPFMSAIKVVGLTAAQIREAIGKQLAAKKLGSVDQVSVSVARK